MVGSTDDVSGVYRTICNIVLDLFIVYSKKESKWKREFRLPNFTFNSVSFRLANIVTPQFER